MTVTLAALALSALAALLAAIVRAITADRPPAAPYVGHHSEDTVELHLRPAGWMPPTGARRISALTDDTIEMEAIS